MRILFISEHLILDSHTGEVIEGLKKNSHYLDLIDYKNEYLRLGKNKFEYGICCKIIEKKINYIYQHSGRLRYQGQLRDLEVEYTPDFFLKSLPPFYLLCLTP